MNRRDFLRLGGVGLAGAVLLGSGAGRALAQAGSSVATEVEGAAGKYGVPAEILLAMSYVNTAWEMPPPGASDYEKGNLHGRGAYGIMQLVQNPWTDTLGRAARLTKLSEDDLKTERAANLNGGAALLASYAGPSKPGDLDGWYDLVAEYADSDYYAQTVFEVLERGATHTTSAGETVELAAQDVDVPQTYQFQAAPDYRRAEWRPAYGGNYSKSRRERSHNIKRIVVHVVQGSKPSAVSWFKNSQANVSAHYVVGKDGRIAQCVRHKDIGWHAGNWTYNCQSIGIEHAGYADDRGTWTKRMYHASARLSAYITKRHKVPIDRRHIIGHREVPGATHYCPGRHFNFTHYLRLIRYYRKRM